MDQKFLTAAVLLKSGHPLVVIDDIKIPELRDGQVLVKMRYAGICHSQLMEAKGLRGTDHWLPHMLGHEGVGEVVAVGDRVKKVSPGQIVVLGWIKGNGIDAGGCNLISESLGSVNAGPVTTFSDFSVVSENRVVPLPENVPLDLGVLLGCALPTGAGIVFNSLEIKAHSTVLVLGLGGIGLSALIALKTFRPKKIIVADIEPSKLELAKRLGANETVLVDGTELERIRLLSNGGVDIAIEAAGSCCTIETAYASLADSGGKCIFASHPAHGDMLSLDPFDLIRGKEISGSWGGQSMPDEDIPKLGSLFSDRDLSIQSLVSKPYFRLKDINLALEALDNRQINRPIIDMAL